MSDAWKPIAHRGQFTMIAMTLARATFLGIPFHTEAALVGEVRPDDGPPVHIGYVSVQSMRLFIDEMQPRALAVEVAPGEDRAALEDSLIFGRGLMH